ncbi:MAG TPA: hypothetical protein VK827_05385 [Lysobacter sp.]|nr:hypothetical protein [Lysobacter sp.]
MKTIDVARKGFSSLRTSRHDARMLRPESRIKVAKTNLANVDRRLAEVMAWQETVPRTAPTAMTGLGQSRDS